MNTTGTIIILKALQNICMLIKLNISKNKYTFTVASDLANAISHNIHLQAVNIIDNDFKTSDAVNILINALKIFPH